MIHGRPSVPVLMYHHIAPSGGVHCVHPDRLRAQLAWLRRKGFALLTGAEFEAFHTGASAGVRRAVLLTFDDGWLDNWVHALPILQELEAPAVFFVVTSWPGAGERRTHLLDSGWRAPDHTEAMRRSHVPVERDSVVMRWSELRAAAATGLVDLQCHSHSHGQWWSSETTGEDLVEALETDLQASISMFVDQVGRRPAQFAWPRGEFTARMRETVRSLGLAVQHSTLRGGNGRGAGQGRMVRRLNAEDQAEHWLRRRLAIYGNPLSAHPLGWMHQELQRQRMRRSRPKTWSSHGGLGCKPWRLV